MFLIVGVLACFCLLAALPVTFFVWHFLTKPFEQTTTTQTGELLYAELSCGDSEHVPIYYPVEDAVIVDSDIERIERIRKRLKKDVATLTPSKSKEAPEPIRKYADRERVNIDHNLKIIK